MRELFRVGQLTVKRFACGITPMLLATMISVPTNVSAQPVAQFPDFQGRPLDDPEGYSRWRMAFRKYQHEHRSSLLAPGSGGNAVLSTPAWTNILACPPGDFYSSEVDITLNPTNPLQVFGGANDQGNGAAGGINGTYYSADGGNTWGKSMGMPSLGGTGYGAWGDPSIAFDTLGHAVYGCIYDTGCGNIACAVASYQSSDGGANWPSGNLFNVATNDDKEWVTCDNVAGSPYNGQFYCSWDYFPGGEENVTTVSTDHGATWGPLHVDGTSLFFVTNAVGPGGWFYVAGHLSGVGEVLRRSTDGGITFPQSTTAYLFQGGYRGGAASVPPQDMVTPGLDVDRGATSPYLGRVYLSVIDRRSGQNHYHVWVLASTDGGQTFGSPVQVDGDVADTTEHVDPWVATSPTNGGVHVFYYDFGCSSPGMAYPYRYEMASSTDGGQTWHQMAVQDTSVAYHTTRTGASWVGDYESGVATDTVIYPFWSDARNGSANSFVQPVPNPMPWITSVSPQPVPRGTTTTITITGGNLVPTITPYAIVFDDPGMTGTITGITNTSATVDVTLTNAVPGGMHEWSLKYGVPVASITVAAAAKSGCQNAINVYAGTSTSTFTITATRTATATRTVTPTITASATVTATATAVVGPVVAYPNPVSIASGTMFTFGSVPTGGVIKIYNVAGELLRTISADTGGNYVWDLTNDSGSPVAKGLYVYRAVYDGIGSPQTGVIGVTP